MPDIALQYIQSLFQLGVGVSIALLYFIEYQVRICEKLSGSLESLRPKLAKLSKFDSRRLKQAHDAPISVMDSNRRNQSLKQHEEVKLLDKTMEIVNRRMWYHIDSLRRHSARLLQACLIVGFSCFSCLLVSSTFPEKKVSPSLIIMFSLVISAALSYLVFQIVFEAKLVEKTYRRRYIKPGERLEEENTPDPKGLQSIVKGDELGVVYYLERQISYRLQQRHEYDFSRYEPTGSQ